MKHKLKLLLFFTSFSLAILLIVLLVPETTHAAIIEPLYKVLGTQDQIKDVWGKVLTFINSLGLAVLIFIAFANILRININNYGIKKFLPTLVLTIIAANFSYLICRLLVDLANVACDLLINGAGRAGITSSTSTDINTAAVTGAFDFTTKNVESFNQYPTVLLLALGEFAGAIMVMILAFLFFIRNYVIYFLIVLSPLAFVSLSIPQAKSFFNQWWSNFMKWTFLPIVSLFWLWLAAQWIGSSFVPGAGTILGFVFAIVCYYMAISTPFKMGGSIMQQWGNLGKKAWGNTGGKITDYYKAKNAALWGARWDNIQNAVKMKTGIGKGLDYAKQKQADAATRRGAISSKYRGEYIERAGVKRGLWDIENQSMQGSEEYFSKRGLALASAVKGYEEVKVEKKRPKEVNGEVVLGADGQPEMETYTEKEMRPIYAYEKAMQKRTGTQFALAQMAIWDGQWSALNNDMKKFLFQQKNPDGSELSEDDKKKRQAFLEEYSGTLWRAQKSEMEATKASGDYIKSSFEG